MRYKCLSCEGLHPQSVSCPICGGSSFKDLFVKPLSKPKPKPKDDLMSQSVSSGVVNGELTNIFLNLGVQ